jgi:GntR family transcriptional regulator
VRARGATPASQVLEARVAPAPHEVSAALRLPPGADVIVLARIRLADGEPLALETAFLPAALFPDLLGHDFAAESLYAVLEHDYKLTLLQAEQTIEATLASQREIKLLKLAPPAAVLKMERLTQTTDGTLVEQVFSIYRADRYKFRSSLRFRAGKP